MAITFGGATGWNGASESLRSLRTKEKAADKSPFTPDTPWWKRQPDMNDPEDYNKFRRRADPSNLSDSMSSLIDMIKRAFPVTGTKPTPIDKSYWSGDYAKNIVDPGLMNRTGKTWVGSGSQFMPEGGDMTPGKFMRMLFPKVNLNDVDYDKTATIADTTVPSEQPTEVSSPLPEEPAPAPVDAPKWYEGGDIGVFGGPVQPTEWTDPETGQKYRVEVSSRGYGWYPVGFGQLDSPAPPDDGNSSGGYDWWNYSGYGGGGGGGGYYSAPSTYSNSNWIDRILTNWRINRK